MVITSNRLLDTYVIYQYFACQQILVITKGKFRPVRKIVQVALHSWALQTETHYKPTTKPLQNYYKIIEPRMQNVLQLASFPTCLPGGFCFNASQRLCNQSSKYLLLMMFLIHSTYPAVRVYIPYLPRFPHPSPKLVIPWEHQNNT